MTHKPTNRGVDVILCLDGEILGGQQSATLSRSVTSIDITNQINGEWQENIAGLKYWSLSCSGIYVKNIQAFDALENAFRNGTKILLELSDGKKQYQGSAIITNFPISVTYNSNFTYSLTLLGVGELR